MTSKLGKFIAIVFPILFFGVTIIVIGSIDIHRTKNTDTTCAEYLPITLYSQTTCTGVNSTNVIANDRGYRTESSLEFGQTAPCWISGENVKETEPPEYQQYVAFRQCLTDLVNTMQASGSSYVVVLCMVVPSIVIGVLSAAGSIFLT